MHTAEARQRRFGRGDRRVIRGVFVLVVGEIRTQVLDVESRLLDRVEPSDQVLEPTLSHHQDNPMLQRIHSDHPLAVLPLVNCCSSSGEMLSSPILLAFSASPWNADAMSVLGSVLPSMIACNTFGSTLPTAFMIAESA